MVPVVEERNMANVEVLRTQAIEKTGEKTVGVPRARSEDKAADTPVAVRRQVCVIQTMCEKDVYENTGDDVLNVLGRGKSADVGLFKQMRGTCNPKSEHLSPDKEKQNIPARTPGIPEVDTRKIRDDPAERTHRVQQAAAKQVWFRFEGKTGLIDIWGQDWEIEKEARENGTWERLGHLYDKRGKED